MDIKLVRTIGEFFSQPANIERRNAWRQIRLLDCPTVINVDEETGFMNPVYSAKPMRLLRLKTKEDEPEDISSGPVTMVKSITITE